MHEPIAALSNAKVELSVSTGYESRASVTSVTKLTKGLQSGFILRFHITQCNAHRGPE